MAQQFLLDKCSTTYVGTWLIKLYLKSLESTLKEKLLSFLRMHNEKLMKVKKGNNQKRKQLWDSFVGESGFKDVDSFLLFQLWKKNLRLNVRRRTLRLDNVLVPILPAEAKAHTQILGKIIGQWDEESPFIAGGDPTTIANKLDEGAIPIGKIYTTIRGGRNYMGRQVEISIALYSLTVNAVRMV